MKFEGDEAKSDACFAERGFDFAYTARAFFDPQRLIEADTRYSYDEERYRLLARSTLCANINETSLIFLDPDFSTKTGSEKAYFFRSTSSQL